MCMYPVLFDRILFALVILDYMLTDLRIRRCVLANPTRLHLFVSWPNPLAGRPLTQSRGLRLDARDAPVHVLASAPVPAH